MAPEAPSGGSSPNIGADGRDSNALIPPPWLNGRMDPLKAEFRLRACERRRHQVARAPDRGGRRQRLPRDPRRRARRAARGRQRPAPRSAARGLPVAARPTSSARPSAPRRSAPPARCARVRGAPRSARRGRAARSRAGSGRARSGRSRSPPGPPPAGRAAAGAPRPTPSRAPPPEAGAEISSGAPASAAGSSVRSPAGPSSTACRPSTAVACSSAARARAMLRAVAASRSAPMPSAARRRQGGAHAHPVEPRVLVRRILRPADPLPAQPAAQRGAPDPEKGPQPQEPLGPRRRQHRRQPVDPGAAREPEQHRLGLVVEGVPERHRADAALACPGRDQRPPRRPRPVLQVAAAVPALPAADRVRDPEPRARAPPPPPPPRPLPAAARGRW